TQREMQCSQGGAAGSNWRWRDWRMGETLNMEWEKSKLKMHVPLKKKGLAGRGGGAEWWRMGGWMDGATGATGGELSFGEFAGCGLAI
ncbi:MAG: hypothetical protein EA402_10095, partial [Planctomycetota bacterium]